MLLLACLAANRCAAAESKPAAPLSMPTFRIESEGFQASEADVRAVVQSATRELWQFFPEHKIEPIVVCRGRQGPITLYQRNDRGEIVVRLDTEKAFWCQYAYQFSHEFCHVLCGFKEGPGNNRWFEETLCETASLFVMRRMARSWKHSAPYPNWADYRDALRDYVDDVVRGRDKIHEIYRSGLPSFHRTHRETLEREPCSRELNGAMSLILLQLFEEKPERWETVRWLNTSVSSDRRTFAEYLRTWHDAVPDRHRAFVKLVSELYGVNY